MATSSQVPSRLSSSPRPVILAFRLGSSLIRSPGLSWASPVLKTSAKRTSASSLSASAATKIRRKVSTNRPVGRRRHLWLRTYFPSQSGAFIWPWPKDVISHIPTDLSLNFEPTASLLKQYCSNRESIDVPTTYALKVIDSHDKETRPNICNPGEPHTLVSVIVDEVFDKLMPRNKIKLLEKMGQTINVPSEALKVRIGVLNDPFLYFCLNHWNLSK